MPTDHGSRPLVAEDGPGHGVPAEDQMEVGSADPTLGHFDQQLARTRFGHRDLAQGDPPIALVDGGIHHIRWHGGHRTAPNGRFAVDRWTVRIEPGSRTGQCRVGADPGPGYLKTWLTALVAHVGSLALMVVP